MKPVKSFIFVFVFAVLANAAGTHQRAIDVSIIRLIAAPEAYANKVVRVIGYLNIEFECNAIYVHEQDFRHDISQNGLWVRAPGEMSKELAKLSGRYVLIEGVFDPTVKGHRDMW